MRRVWLHLHHTLLFRYLYTLVIPTYTFSSQDWTIPTLLASPHMTHTSIPLSSSWSFARLAPVCSCSSCYEEPRAGPSTPRCHFASATERNTLHLMAMHCLQQSRMLFRFCVQEHTVDSTADVLNTKTASSVFCEDAFQSGSSQCPLEHEIIPSHGQDFRTPLCGTSLDSCWPFSPTCQDPPKWQHRPSDPSIISPSFALCKIWCFIIQ